MGVRGGRRRERWKESRRGESSRKREREREERGRQTSCSRKDMDKLGDGLGYEPGRRAEMRLEEPQLLFRVALL